MTKKPKKRPADPVVNFATLDGSGLLIGYAMHRRSAAPAQGIEVPDDCDLAAGRYRWDTEQESFIPVPPKNPLDPLPDATRAIWKGFMALREQGLQLPQETLDWMDIYGKSFDAKKGKAGR